MSANLIGIICIFVFGVIIIMSKVHSATVKETKKLTKILENHERTIATYNEAIADLKSFAEKHGYDKEEHPGLYESAMSGRERCPNCHSCAGMYLATKWKGKL